MPLPVAERRSGRLAAPRIQVHRALVRMLALGAALTFAGPLPAQSVSVIANRNLRPTAVLQPHVRFVVGADSAEGVVLIRDLGIPPVTFGGTVRIEGIQPGARTPERQPFADTVRFEADGRVLFQLADATGRPPMTAEIIGARTAAAGRLVITAPGLPLGRVILVTIAPADLYELTFRRVGFGVRDRLRIDDRAGLAFLADSTAGPTTVAIGFGRGTHGRIQQDVADVVLMRDFGGEAGRERRQVGALILAAEPDRNEGDGPARVEIVFGVGNSEGEAAQAARDAANEAALGPAAAALRVRTPSPQVDLLVRHLLAAAGWTLNWDAINLERSLVASAARPTVRPVEAWLGASVALQRGDTSAVCGSYRLLRRAFGPGAAPLELAPRLGPRGRFAAVSDSTDAAADASLMLLGYACYAAGGDPYFLRAEFPAFSSAAERAARDLPGELSAEALARLGELSDELARISDSERGPGGDSLRAEAARLAGSTTPPLPAALWRTITAEAQRGLSRDYGRLSSGTDGGLSLAAAGTFLDLVLGEIFGVTGFLDRLEIAPQVSGIADTHSWQLEGLLLGRGDTLGMTYRPADGTATIRLSARHRQRVVLRFPWLHATSCATARRGADTDRLTLTEQADGSFYTDLRAALAPSVLTISTGACP